MGNAPGPVDLAAALRTDHIHYEDGEIPAYLRVKPSKLCRFGKL